MFRDVIETGFQAVERIAGCCVLLNDKPFATRLFRSRNDALPFQVALSDFAEIDFVVVGNSVIFQVQKRKSIAQLFAPTHNIAAAELNPIGVDFGLHNCRIDRVVDVIENGFVIQLAKLQVMIVIRQHLTGGLQGFSRAFDVRRVLVYVLQSLDWISAGRWHRGVFAVQLLQAFDDELRRFK